MDQTSVCGQNQQTLVAMATSLGDQNTHVRLIIYIHSSTSPENLAKIAPVDVEIIGLTEIIKV